MITLGGLALLAPVAVAVFSYEADFRPDFVFMAAFAAASPTFLGCMGVIPIPGLDIET